MECFWVAFMKIFKEGMQQGYPRKVEGGEGGDKSIKDLAYEVICVLLGTEKGRKETW